MGRGKSKKGNKKGRRRGDVSSDEEDMPDDSAALAEAPSGGKKLKSVRWPAATCGNGRQRAATGGNGRWRQWQ